MAHRHAIAPLDDWPRVQFWCAIRADTLATPSAMITPSEQMKLGVAALTARSISVASPCGRQWWELGLGCLEVLGPLLLSQCGWYREPGLLGCKLLSINLSSLCLVFLFNAELTDVHTLHGEELLDSLVTTNIHHRQLISCPVVHG